MGSTDGNDANTDVILALCKEVSSSRGHWSIIPSTSVPPVSYAVRLADHGEINKIIVPEKGEGIKTMVSIFFILTQGYIHWF